MTPNNNCWEIRKCGREPGGNRVEELGVCPAAADSSFDRINHGVNGGRFCWAITGTFCGGRVQGLFAMKIENCVLCPVFSLVTDEEGEAFVMHPEDVAARR